MINRELIRIKIVQLVYAYEQNGSNNIDRAEKELIFSLSKAYHLYNYLLLLIVAITKEARHHVEIGEARARREGKPMPSAKFANNKFVLQLEENRMLNEFVEMQKLSWDDDIEFVRKLYSLIVDCETYKEYMASDDDSYDADRELWRKLYKLFIMDNDDFESLLEEKSLYWNDDKEVVDTFVLKTIRRFDPSKMTEMELLPEFIDFFPQADFLGTMGHWKADTAEKVIQAGALGSIVKPFRTRDILKAIELYGRRGQKRPTRTMAFFSPKGHSGRTTLATSRLS